MIRRTRNPLSRLLERVRPSLVRGRDSTDADEAVARRLTAFSRAELSASDETMRRIEDQMVAAFQRSANGSQRARLAAPASSASALSGGIRRSALGPLRLHRPATAIALAAVMLVGLSSVTVAESGPGHLFYRARLAVETLTLPAKDSEGRIEAQLGRLTLRLNEADEAGRHGDVRAIGEAMEVYDQTLSEVVELSRSHPNKIELATSMLGRDLDALHVLADRVPAGAGAGVREAMEQTISAYRAIDPTR